MPRNKSTEAAPDLLRKLIIVQLGLARVPQQQIRKIVGDDINSVNAIVKNLRVRDRTGKQG
jgi:hypothetical protein